MSPNNIRLGISEKKKVYAGLPEQHPKSVPAYPKSDVTEDFKRCVVRYCGDSVVFQVDGMIFHAKCERIG